MSSQPKIIKRDTTIADPSRNGRPHPYGMCGSDNATCRLSGWRRKEMIDKKQEKKKTYKQMKSSNVTNHI